MLGALNDSSKLHALDKLSKYFHPTLSLLKCPHRIPQGHLARLASSSIRQLPSLRVRWNSARCAAADVVTEEKEKKPQAAKQKQQQQPRGSGKAARKAEAQSVTAKSEDFSRCFHITAQIASFHIVAHWSALPDNCRSSPSSDLKIGGLEKLSSVRGSILWR